MIIRNSLFLQLYAAVQNHTAVRIDRINFKILDIVYEILGYNIGRGATASSTGFTDILLKILKCHSQSKKIANVNVRFRHH